MTNAEADSRWSADWLACQFELNRPRLHRIAQRTLGSAIEADDALQETWLRASRGDLTKVTNVRGWLTTLLWRACFDELRRRNSRREHFMADDRCHTIASVAPGEMPEEEAMLLDSMSAALLILLYELAPAERIAFVLHDMFDMRFDQIAPILGKSVAAARQLASRGRRRARRAASSSANGQRCSERLYAFLQASRSGNISALLVLLAPSFHKT